MPGVGCMELSSCCVLRGSVGTLEAESGCKAKHLVFEPGGVRCVGRQHSVSSGSLD